FQAFFHASFMEKITAFIVIFIIINKNKTDFYVSESITISIFFALGFSALENIFYAYEIQKTEVILRFFSSVPLHITTCAIMGYNLGLYKIAGTKVEKYSRILFSFFIPILFHFLYDMSLLKGKEFTYIIAPELVILLSIQEYLIAKSTSFPGTKDLRVKKVELEDWEIIHRQVEYDRWILRSMGKRNVEIMPFFQFFFSGKRKLFIGLFIAFPLFIIFTKWVLKIDFALELKFEEQITLLILYPLVGSFNLLLAGSINREYFKNSIFSLPIVAEAKVFVKKEEHELNGSDISLNSCFIKTLESFEIGDEIELIYNYSANFSPRIRGKVIWDNHENLLEPIGSLLRINNFNWQFIKFIINYRFFRWTRGIIFNLKIPGFESLRNHFVKAISVMEDHAYVAEGTILFEEGEKGRDFYLLKKGLVEIYKTTEMGEKVVLNMIEPGNIFGEMSMITGHPRAATAICKTNCLISTSDGDNLEALVLNNPQFSYKLMQTLATRLSKSEGILMSKIQILEAEMQLLKEQNAIYEEFFNTQTPEPEVEQAEIQVEEAKTIENIETKEKPKERKPRKKKPRKNVTKKGKTQKDQK
ncbi:MAG: cyclic nucleotide-binding domain-containing protein, partial [Leptospiraceae bacterium]|nr:cyclic nucleotide-binding domain-containing protein [Leptospiraceae bacterium]